jgi:hypothetical protein
LSAHRAFHCGPETHVFNKLSSMAVRNALTDVAWPAAATRLLCSLTINGNLVHRAFALKPQEVRRALAMSPRTLASLAACLPALAAAACGKPAWVEKTPNHLLHLAAIRSCFPTARIVRIVRDPRAVSLSMRALPWASQTALANTYLWREWDLCSADFCAHDTRTTTVAYEALVHEPTRVLTDLCHTLGVDFEPTMLDTSRSAPALIAPGEHWKNRAAEPITTARSGRWCAALSDDEVRTMNLVAWEGLTRYRYDAPQHPAATVVSAIVTRPWVEANAARLHELARQRTRVVPLVASLEP